MELSLLQAITILGITLAVIYLAAWLASHAFFTNKADYHKKLLQQLEEKADAEKEG